MWSPAEWRRTIGGKLNRARISVSFALTGHDASPVPSSAAEHSIFLSRAMLRVMHYFLQKGAEVLTVILAKVVFDTGVGNLS